MSKQKTCMCGSEELTLAYHNDPAIENYVALRRAHPNVAIRIARSSAMEWIWSNTDTLQHQGIEPELFADVIENADPEAISELSLVLLERLAERKSAERSGETHLVRRGEAISDMLVNYLINATLDAMEWTGRTELSSDLIVLIRCQTGGGKHEWDKELEIREKRTKAVVTALQLVLQGEVPTVRKLASAVGVNASTIARWFSGGELADLKNAADAMLKRGTPSEGETNA